MRSWAPALFYPYLMQISRALIVGGQGSLAVALKNAAPAQVECQSVNRAALDICDGAAVRALLENARPDIVLNGAAYNAVDRAQNEGAAEAIAINATGVANLALACRDLDIPFVHFSSDFVFDGHKRTPYSEADATGPLSVYGASKLCGENIALTTAPRNLAIRVCRLFGPTTEDGSGSARKPGGNFPLLMLRLARERGGVRVVDDQIGSPSYTPDIARGVWQLLANDAAGLFHLSNAGEVSFADYAAAVFEIAGVNCPVERVSSAQYDAPAARPMYSTLSNDKATAAGVTPLRHWHDALAEFLADAE